MNIPTTNNEVDTKSLWTQGIFSGALVLLLAVGFGWGLIIMKTSWQEKNLLDLNKKMQEYNTSYYKDAEKTVLDYKKKIEDLGQIMTNRKLSAQIFKVIEANTLPRVWFSSFMMSGVNNTVALTGEAETIPMFGQQVRVFEEDHEYITSVVITGSQIQPDGKVFFSLQLTLDPKVFNYADIFLPTAVSKPL